ncbi:hypothetical protein fugu_003333 [Takifugu bimaculatus]|uniref:Thyroglobulin type-1 domain-containing protein n=1 Tax=Takifugu bimaculatus TaxID=433685 RepID=A0A4Z2BF82_9TELE|nr:hypothetical protein fugu_003333 [Takifugu bimaculatus]
MSAKMKMLLAVIALALLVEANAQSGGFMKQFAQAANRSGCIRLFCPNVGDRWAGCSSVAGSSRTREPQCAGCCYARSGAPLSGSVRCVWMKQTPGDARPARTSPQQAREEVTPSACDVLQVIAWSKNSGAALPAYTYQ